MSTVIIPSISGKYSHQKISVFWHYYNERTIACFAHQFTERCYNSVGDKFTQSSIQCIQSESFCTLFYWIGDTLIAQSHYSSSLLFYSGHRDGRMSSGRRECIKTAKHPACSSVVVSPKSVTIEHDNVWICSESADKVTCGVMVKTDEMIMLANAYDSYFLARCGFASYSMNGQNSFISMSILIEIRNILMIIRWFFLWSLCYSNWWMKWNDRSKILLVKLDWASRFGSLERHELTQSFRS
jgi:hypothetical protein